MRSTSTKGLNWLVENRNYFNPFINGIDEPSEKYQTALAELALICFRLNSRESHGIQEYKHRMLPDQMDFLIKVIKDSYECPALCYYPFKVDQRSISGHLILWLLLRSLGIETPIPKEDFQELISNGGIESLPRPAFRDIELVYLLELGGFSHRLRPIHELYGETFLAKTSISSIRPEDIYDMTHTLFYITDFGRFVPQYISKSEEEKITGFLKALMIIMADLKNWDLVSELIISCHCLGVSEDDSINSSWNLLENVQHSSGYIPGWGFKESCDDHTTFWRCYHPTLVTIMADLIRESRPS